MIWLHKYQEQIPLWEKMTQMTRILEKQLKIWGLNRQSVEQFSGSITSMSIPQSLEPFKQKILNYLQAEISPLEDNRSVLATSDVIESIFGKYKCFSQRCPLQDLRDDAFNYSFNNYELDQRSDSKSFVRSSWSRSIELA